MGLKGFTLKMMMENWLSLEMISKLSARGIRNVYDFYDTILLYDYDLISMHHSLPEFSFALHFNNFTVIKDGIK
jgi:hypothetical protein